MASSSTYVAAAENSASSPANTPLIVLTKNDDTVPSEMVHSASANRLSTTIGKPTTPAGSSPTGSLCGGSNGKFKTCTMTHGFGAATPTCGTPRESEQQQSEAASAVGGCDVPDATAKCESVKPPLVMQRSDSTIRRGGTSVRRNVGDHRSLVKSIMIDVVPCFRNNKVIQQRWQLFLMALMLCLLGLVALAITFTVWRMKDSFAYALVPLLLGGLFFIPGVYYLVLMCLVMSSRSRFTLDMLPTME